MPKPSRVRRRTKKQPSRKGPHPIDVHVGSRVRLRRRLLGITQRALGKDIGVTQQQLQKYERGVNRIGASRLFNLGRALEVLVFYFFEGPFSGSGGWRQAPRQRSQRGAGGGDRF